MNQLNLSAQAYRPTMADLARSEEIQPPHLADVSQYRSELTTEWQKVDLTVC